MYLDSAYSVNEKTRQIQSDWHKLVLAVARCASDFQDAGSTRESSQLYAYMTTFAQHAARHLERVAGSNGHHKDSTHADERGGDNSDQGVTKDGQTPVDEKGVCAGGGSYEDDSASRSAPGTVAVAVPSNGDVEGELELLIDQLGDLMARHGDHQPYEVALKMLYRGRSLAREGKKSLAERQLRAARNTLGEAKEMGLR